MESDEIQLIIKAPNQNVDDQVIHCSLEWTVERLKRHLSQVYPNKPAFNEQKVIYSGRLLHDHLHLQDVLRHEDKTTSVHTLHLVCNRQWKYAPKEQPPQPAYHSYGLFTDSSGGTTDSDDFETEPELTEGSPTHSSSDYTPMAEQVAEANEDSDEPAAPYNQYAEQYAQLLSMQQMYANLYSRHSQNASVAAPVWPTTNFTPTAPTDTASQIATMQQMYANYYQYLQNMHATAWLPNYFFTPGVAQQYSFGLENSQQDGVPNAYQQNLPNRNLMMNAQGGPLLDDNDHGNRDWLDYFYMCCRGFVLFSIVYFYSSPERLMLVVGLAFLALLYQEGWILARARTNRLLGNRENPARAAPNENHNHTEDAVPANNQNGENADRHNQHVNEIEAIMDGDDPPHAQNRNAGTNHSPAWTFISSFFSSLIPEPPAPVNIN